MHTNNVYTEFNFSCSTTNLTSNTAHQRISAHQFRKLLATNATHFKYKFKIFSFGELEIQSATMSWQVRRERRGDGARRASNNWNRVYLHRNEIVQRQKGSNAVIRNLPPNKMSTHWKCCLPKLLVSFIHCIVSRCAVVPFCSSFHWFAFERGENVLARVSVVAEFIRVAD